MKKFSIIFVLAICAILSTNSSATDIKLTVEAGKPVHAMSKDMYGLFFEDINFAADGGLYAEMVWNRSFEFSEGLFSWKPGVLNGADAIFALKKDQDALNGNNPTYVEINITKAGKVTLLTDGFRGMVLNADKNYDFSFYTRSAGDYNGSVLVELLTANGTIASSTTIESITTEWKKYSFKLKSSASDTNACLSLSFNGSGKVAVDMVSLFPEDTWKHQPNGLRADLVQILADMKPAFLRFPGGCIVEGKTLDNAYRWKDTIGDPAERKVNWNRWAGWDNPPQYYQSYGLGFFEYFRQMLPEHFR